MNDALTDLGKIRGDRLAMQAADWYDALMGEGRPATHQTPVLRDQWILDFDYRLNPIPLNGSRHSHHAHAAKVRAVRMVAKREAENMHIPRLGRCRAQLTWYVTTRGRRDVENLAFTLKAMCDGLVDAGVVPDDTPDLMDKPQSRIILVDPEKNAQAWMELTVTRWAGPDQQLDFGDMK